MELQERLEYLQKALDNLSEAIQNASDDLEIDGAILRFELVYELMWKCLAQALKQEGVHTASPRQAFKSSFQMGWIQHEMQWLNMIEDRNTLVHKYSLELSREIFERVKDSYFNLLQNAYSIIKSI